MATRMQQRRGTEAQWTSANPVLAAGEIGFETDTNQFKIGDGVNVWADLSYFQTIDTLGGSLDDYVPLSTKGQPLGVATLDGLGQVPVSQLQNLIDNAPDTLNTLNEIADAITVVEDLAAGVQSNLDAAIAQEVLDRNTAITGAVGQEALDRADAIETAINLEVLDRNAAIDEAINTESGARTVAIEAAIDLEVSDRNDAIAAAIGQEVLDRNAAIGSAIADEELARDTAITAAVTGLATDANAQAYADTAEADAKAYTDTEIDAHVAVTLNVHGIANTAELETQTGAQAKADLAQGAAENYTDTHELKTTNIHGIADTAALATKSYADSAVSTHSADTTGVHGIADTSKLVTTDAVSTTLDGSLTIDGNLIVNGTTTTVSAQDLVVSDPLIYIGEGNNANLVDLGLVSSFDNGTYQHSGIARDASDNKWKIFKGVTDEPTTTINFAQGSLDDLAVNNVEVAGVVFSDGTQSKQGVPSLTPISQKTDSYTLAALTERDSLIEINKASAVTLTIPTDASVNFPVGTSIDILQTGAGQVTIAGAGGVTVNATPGLKLRTQWSSATLFKRAANTWVVYGDLSA